MEGDLAGVNLKSRVDGREVWGVGMATAVVTAMVRAAVSAVNQGLPQAAPATPADLVPPGHPG